MEFLTGEGITHVENVLLSHADQDHIEGLLGLLASDRITIKNVFVNSDAIKDSALWDDLTYTLSKSSVAGGTQIFSAITRSTSPFHCGDITIETISPTAYLATKSPGSKDRLGRRITSNSVSASFRLLWAGAPVAYLAGDIDQISLDSLKDHDIQIQAPLLVFPHHGGDISIGNIVSFTEELCSLTASDTVIFSIGRNKHKNPRPDVVAAVRRKIKNVRIACTQLSKHCASTLNGTVATHLNGAFSRGRANHECCSGTFVINLAEGVSYSPDIAAHRTFISAAATTPICIN